LNTKPIAMLKLGELKAGDIVQVNDDRVGTIVEISHEEHKALVDNGVQEFWYGPEELSSILVNERQLLNLGFEKQDLNGEGTKYSKGAFRLVTPKAGDFSSIEMWYREDRRHFNHPISVHQLQNLHLQMTKVPLDKPA
jgi:hypothetical protein